MPKLNPSSGQEHLPPDYGHFVNALRNVGYTFEESVADIVDNSIDAKATHVQIRFIVREDRSVDLLIADDGEGMNSEKLREAMIFGIQPLEKYQKRLGYFGLGLKMASISQAIDLFVVSLKDGEVSGRAWTDQGLKKGFYCDKLTKTKIAEIQKLSDLPNELGHGTWVLWEYLHRFSKDFGSPEMLCDSLSKSLVHHLSLHFHRLLNGTAITIDSLYEQGDKFIPSARREIKALDPFGYSSSGHPDYPLQFHASGKYAKKLEIRAHVWPPHSTSPNYKLPGGAVQRQGLYFYRNERLICGGGWFHIKEALDTHDSLSRVEIHLKDHDLEREVSLDVRKALVKVTPPIREAIVEAVADNGKKFIQFLSEANKTYRAASGNSKGTGNSRDKAPLVPTGAGFPVGIQDLLAKFSGAKPDAIKRKVEFLWVEFDERENDRFFRLDHMKAKCFLNSIYADLFSESRKDASSVALLAKTQLFLLIGKYFDRDKLSESDEKWIDGLAQLLGSAALLELHSTK